VPTKFYFPSSGTPPATPAVDAQWEQSAASFYRAPSPRTKSNTPLTDFSAIFGSTSTGQTCWGQFITDPLDGAQTIDGDMNIVVAGLEANAANDVHIAFICWVLKPDGTSRGELCSWLTTGTEFTTARQTRIVLGRAITALACQHGDRIVMEVGLHGVTPANATNNTLRFGDPSATADFAATSGLTTDLVPWWRHDPLGATELVFQTPGATGTGDIDTAGVSSTGAGKAGAIGSGTAQQAGLSTTAAGKAGAIGSGSITPAGLSSAGAGALSISGTGTITVAGLDTDGTGTAGGPPVEPEGAGALTTSGLSVAGQGKAGAIGAGAIAVGGVGTAGAGAQVFSGVGAVTVGGLVTAGAGKTGSIGSGAVSPAGLSTAGTGTVTGGPTAGAGSLGIAGLTMAGTGTVTAPPSVTPIDPWFPGRGEQITWQQRPPAKKKRVRHRHPLRIPRALRQTELPPVEFPPPLIIPPLELPQLEPFQPRSPFDLPQGRPPLPVPAEAVAPPTPAEPEGAHWSEYADQPYTCRDEIEDMELILAAVVQALQD
jgi:hypothetical protein